MNQPVSKQDILDYIDHVLHPIISPEYYDCDLHDMVENCPELVETK